MVLRVGSALAADMAWECRSFTTALEAVEYRDASVDGGLEDVYDTLYALIDANCEVTACEHHSSCEEIVDCITEAGDLINWTEVTALIFDGEARLETLEVVPSASSGYGWTRAEVAVEEEQTWYTGAYGSEVIDFNYDGDWESGFPTDGVLQASHWGDGKGSESDGWDDGTCAWTRAFSRRDEWSNDWYITVDGSDLLVEYVFGDYYCPARSEEAAAYLNGSYIGLVHQRTWEVIPDADLDGSPTADDCDDADPARSPCAYENPHDSIDNDCDGVADDGDADGDGFLSPESGGEDCDDDVATTYPGAPDVHGDGVDQDCNGVDLPALRRVRYGSGPLVRP